MLKAVFERIGNEALKRVLEAEAALPGATGAEKRDFVARRLDEMVKLPWWLEPFDGALFGLAIDVVCGALNESFGHRWQKLTKEAGKR